jgi:hypothetical protein
MYELRKHSALNPIENEKILENIEFWHNSGNKELEQCKPHSGVLTILAGGKSLELYKGDGSNAVACGSAMRAINKLGIIPEKYLHLDPQTGDFGYTIPEATTSIISVTSPKTLNDIINNKEKIRLFYPACMDYMPEKNKIINTTTVGVTAIVVGLYMGYRNFEAYGLDSCFIDNNHHCGYYNEYENELVDKQGKIDVVCNGKTFICTPQMAMQALDFKDVCKLWGNKFNIKIHGEGLLAEMMKGN